MTIAQSVRPSESSRSGRRTESAIRRAAVGPLLEVIVLFAMALDTTTALGHARPAGATTTSTVPPTLSVNPTSAPSGSVVTISFGPNGNGCAQVAFSTSPADAPGPEIALPLFDHGAERFVMPAAFTTSAPATVVTVAPGTYWFTLACDTSNNPATLRTVSVPFVVTPPQPPHFVGMATTPDPKVILARSEQRRCLQPRRCRVLRIAAGARSLASCTGHRDRGDLRWPGVLVGRRRRRGVRLR